MKNPQKIEKAEGKLGILLVGLGAVSTTTIAGVIAIRSGLAKPIGSLTQMGTIRLGKRTESDSPRIKDFVPLASLDDIVFGGWDIFDDNCYEAAKTAGVLERDAARADPPRARSDQADARGVRSAYVKRLDGPNVKKGKNKRDLAEQLSADIRKFKADNGLQSPGDGLVRQHRGLPDGVGRCTRRIEAFEKGARGERRRRSRRA